MTATLFTIFNICPYASEMAVPRSYCILAVGDPLSWSKQTTLPSVCEYGGTETTEGGEIGCKTPSAWSSGAALNLLLSHSQPCFNRFGVTSKRLTTAVVAFRWVDLLPPVQN
jgi:hypothetical protein